MSTHKTIKELLVSYVLGDLSEGQTCEVKSHVTMCQQCKDELKRLEALLECSGKISKLSADEQMLRSAKDRLFTTVSSEGKLKAIAWPNIGRAFRWRMIMKSTITKIAAAAVIAIVAMVAMYQLGNSIDGSAAALARVVDNTGRMPWLHQVAKGFVNSEQVTLEQWVSFDSKTCATKRSDGSIEYRNLTEFREYVYDPCSQTITVSLVKKKDYPAFVDIAFPAFYLDGVIKKLGDEGGEVAKRTDKYKGKAVDVYEVSFSEHTAKASHLKLFVNSEKHLVIGEEVKATDEYGRILIDCKIEIDYPENGPVSIYELGVPGSAKVVYPEREKTAFQVVFEAAITAIDARESWPAPRDLVITYWEARAAKEYGEMAILWPGSALWNRDLESEKAAAYVFGDVQGTGSEGHIIVPYASKEHYERNNTYNLKMRLSNERSAKGRYYIVSGN